MPQRQVGTMNYGIAFTPAGSLDRALASASRRHRRHRRLLVLGRAARRRGAGRSPGADPARARQSVVYAREPRTLVVGRRGRGRQEPEPEFRRPQPADRDRRARQLVDGSKKIKGLEVRVVEAGQADGETDGTKLFRRLASTLSDVPVDRVAGVFLITDGRVHDIPANAATLGFRRRCTRLITGTKDERDRRIAIVGRAALRHRRPDPEDHLPARRPGRQRPARQGRRCAATAR